MPAEALALVLGAAVAHAVWNFAAKRVNAVWSAYRREIVTIAVLSLLAYVLVLQALTMAPVSLAA